MIEPIYEQLSKEDLEQIYHKDYNGDMGLLKFSHIQWDPSNKAHMYIGVYDDPHCADHRYFLGHFFIGFHQHGLTLDFAGSPIMGSNNRDDVEAEYAKHIEVKP